jgi:hypothetical protein
MMANPPLVSVLPFASSSVCGGGAQRPELSRFGAAQVVPSLGVPTAREQGVMA